MKQVSVYISKYLYDQFESIDKQKSFNYVVNKAFNDCFYSILVSDKPVKVDTYKPDYDKISHLIKTYNDNLTEAMLNLLCIKHSLNSVPDSDRLEDHDPNFVFGDWNKRPKPIEPTVRWERDSEVYTEYIAYMYYVKQLPLDKLNVVYTYEMPESIKNYLRDRYIISIGLDDAALSLLNQIPNLNMSATINYLLYIYLIKQYSSHYDLARVTSDIIKMNISVKELFAATIINMNKNKSSIETSLNDIINSVESTNNNLNCEIYDGLNKLDLKYPGDDVGVLDAKYIKLFGLDAYCTNNHRVFNGTQNKKYDEPFEVDDDDEDEDDSSYFIEDNNDFEI